LQNKKRMKGRKSRGKPLFLTCEMMIVERFTLSLECLTGQEEGLAPARSLSANTILFRNLV
jgi:hypothetical protein